MADEDLNMLTAATLLLAGAGLKLALLKKIKRKRKLQRIRHSFRAKSKNFCDQPKLVNVCNDLMEELCLENDQAFYDYHQLSKEDFKELLELVLPLIQKQDTKLKKAIPASHRLSVTLHYLVTGESYQSMGSRHHFSHNLICRIIPEVCDAIYVVLKQTYLRLPATFEEWQEVADGYSSLWNFPNCLGALDGKSFNVNKPADAVPQYMLSLVDANYNYMFVDIGPLNNASDVGPWGICTLKEKLEENKLGVPDATNLPYTNIICPYVFVGHDAFPLETYLMKPYSGNYLTSAQRIFNYRHSGARKVAENAFGMLSAKFRIFEKPINLRPENLKKVIYASVVLHNFLKSKCKAPRPSELLKREYHTSGPVRGVTSYENLQAVNLEYSERAKAVRETLNDYFVRCR